MWGIYRKTEKTIAEIETIEKLQKKVTALEEERRVLKEEVENLKLKKKIEEEDIKHMVRIKEERLAIDHERKIIELEKKTQDEIAKVKDGYRDKVEGNLEKQIERSEQMYSEILERLPNINVNMKGKVS
jgi:hypothetical protein